MHCIITRSTGAGYCQDVDDAKWYPYNDGTDRQYPSRMKMTRYIQFQQVPDAYKTPRAISLYLNAADVAQLLHESLADAPERQRPPLAKEYRRIIRETLAALADK